MVRGHAVFESVRSAGVGTDVATDGAGGLAGGIGRVKQTATLDGIRHGCIDATSFNQRAAVDVIDFYNFGHARESNHDTATHCENGATEACAGAARDDWNVMFGAKFYEGCNLFRGSRQDHNSGQMLLQRVGVAFVDEQLVGL